MPDTQYVTTWNIRRYFWGERADKWRKLGDYDEHLVYVIENLQS